MNILYIVPYVPDLVRVRPYNLIRHLTAAGHQVCVATLWSTPAELNALNELKKISSRVISSQLKRWQSLVACAITLPTSQPLQAAFCWQLKFAEQLADLVSQTDTPFDVIHVEHLRGVRYGLYLKAALATHGIHTPIVWDSVDCITHLFRQAATKSTRLSSRMMAIFETERTAQYEGWLRGQFDEVLVTSSIDRQAFLALSDHQLQPAEITVLPNGVDLDYFAPSTEIVREPATIVLSGKMSYHANVAMALHLVNHILPLVWSEMPEVKLWIVGKDPPDSIRKLAQNPLITVTGTVPDLRPYLQKATLAAAPITYGAGIQNKVLEAMACATPTITSPQAVSALEIVPGQDLLVANTPAECAQGILKLLQNPTLAREVGISGRKYVENHHNWTTIALNLANIYRQAAGRLPEKEQKK
jgi:polysaccharide biosynthesis protein PslH